MIGIPFTIQRESEHGAEIETIYLRTRRRGPEGEKMRRLIREYNQADLAQKRASIKVAMFYALVAGNGEHTPDLAALEKADKDQDEAIAVGNAAAKTALECAELIAELALRENYPQELAEKILDKLTDVELRAIVSTIEMGAMPKDFFQSLDIQRKQRPTGHSGNAQVESSPAQDSQEPTSKAAE